MATDKAPMQSARYNAPAVLIRDRFLFVMGGIQANHKATNSVECYDIHMNTWYPVKSMDRAR